MSNELYPPAARHLPTKHASTEQLLACLQGSGTAKWSQAPGAIGAWVAESDFGTAPAVAQFMQRAVADHFFGYTPDDAGRRMAQGCAKWLADHYGWQVPTADIHPVSDVVVALEITLREFTKPGSAVVVPTPAYMPFLTLPVAMGRRVIEVPMVRGVDASGAARWEHDLAGIDAALADGGGVVLLCNPHNPLGRVFDRAELLALSDVVARHGARVFADEIHAPIRYDGRAHVPFASLDEQAAALAVTATSTSKAFNTPGLKCAQLILTAAEDRAEWQRFGWFASHGASALGVLAAEQAYEHGGAWLSQFVDVLAANRALLGDLLPEMAPGVRFTAPEATYLAWLDVRDFDLGDRPGAWFAKEAGVTLIDGAACGAAGVGHVRLNFATPPEILTLAVQRIGEALARR